jgi:hypothetical protein
VDYVFSVSTSIPSHPAAQFPGNELLASQLLLNNNVIGYEINYLGVLPRASVEVVVI